MLDCLSRKIVFQMFSNPTPTPHHLSPNPQLLTSTIAACTIDILPAIALLDHRLQIFLPDQLVLHGVFDDRADQAGGYVGGVEPASPKCAASASPLFTTEI